MSVEAMKPLGLAIKEYYEGNKDAANKIFRDDGKTVTENAGIYFRSPEEYFPIEKEALVFCKGKVLVAGAGAGALSLALQDRKFDVLAIEISPENCEVLKKRGQKNVLCADFMRYRGEMFDTICLLGRNIGMAGKLSGLKRLLNHIGSMLKPDGIVLLNSWDFRFSQDPSDIEYQKRNVKRGKYFGEVKYTLEYKGIKGAEFRWLYLDFETLKKYSEKAGWYCERLSGDSDGGYLVKLTPAC